ncbi:MAG TPA: hypothetical protein VE999_14025 [Gemmataceae bacterium]|nr:hypothetical protein [Gemmataceae bacterium]
MKIRVFAGPRIIDVCDSVSVRRYIGAPNAEVIRKRKTGQIVQINLLSYGDDSVQKPRHDSDHSTYEEHLGAHTLLMLKRVDPETGQLVRWSDRDQFNPRRFNPDTVQSSAVSSRNNASAV